MGDNIKISKSGSTPYVKGKSTNTSASNHAGKTSVPITGGILSEQLERIIKSVSEDSVEIDATEQIHALKSQLRQGTYEIDSDKLADNLLQEYAPELAVSEK